VTVRRGRRRKKLLDGLEEKRGYFKLKEEELDLNLWGTRVGRRCRSVARRCRSVARRCRSVARRCRSVARRCRSVARRTMAWMKWLEDDSFERNMQLRTVRRISLLLMKVVETIIRHLFNPLNAELNPICCLLALLRAHHFLHVSRIRVKSLTLRLLKSCLYGAPILDVSRSHITTHHSR